MKLRVRSYKLYIMIFFFIFLIINSLVPNILGSTGTFGNIAQDAYFQSSDLASSPWEEWATSPDGIDPEDQAFISNIDDQLVLQVHDDAFWGEDLNEHVEAFQVLPIKYTLPDEDQVFIITIDYTLILTGDSGMGVETTDVTLNGFLDDNHFFIDGIFAIGTNQAPQSKSDNKLKMVIIPQAQAASKSYMTNYIFGIYLESNSICFEQYVRAYINYVTVEVEYFDGMYDYPETPSILSPKDNVLLDTNDITYDWAYSDSDAINFELELDGSYNGRTTATDEIDYVLDGLHNWRVRAFDGYKWGPFSAYGYFEIDTEPPGIPELISPADDAVFGTDYIYFSWSSVADADSYRIDVDGTIYTSGSNSRWISLPDGTFNWKVCAIDDAANIGPWSNERTIEVDTEDPGIPELISPADDLITSTTYTLFDWSSVSDAVDYDLDIDGTIYSRPFSNHIVTLGEGTHNWRVRAIDNAGNIGSYSDYWTVIVDVTQPDILSINHSPITPTDADSVTISCSVTDNTGITSVTLHYRIDGGSWQTTPMSFISGSTWNDNIGSFSADTLIEYYISAIDYANIETTNDNSGSYYSFTIQDVEDPNIVSITHSPVNPTDADSVTISCSVTDNTGIASVTLHYRIDGGSWQTTPMSLDSGSIWDVNIGSYSADVLIEYYITAIDSSSNANEFTNDNSGSYYSFTVQDMEDPTITSVAHSPIIPTDSDSVTISCSVDDNTGIASVTLHYRLDGGLWQTVAMSLDTGSAWNVIIGPFSADVLVEYYITTIDSSLNANEFTNDNSGSYYSFTVQDMDDPTITSVIHDPINPTDLDTVTISCSVTDNTGITSVTLHYKLNGNPWQTVAMSFVSGSTWEAVLGPYIVGDVIDYYISAIDSSGNANEAIEDNSSSFYSFECYSNDITPPDIDSVTHTPVIPADSDSITISCSVTDNFGIASVTLHYRIDGGSWQTVAMSLDTGSTWEAVVGPFAVGVVIEYYITAIDSSANANEFTNDNSGSFYSFTIQDMEDPTITSVIHSPVNPNDSDSVTISCSVTDNTGITSVTLHYRIDGGSWQTVAMSLDTGSTWEAVIGPFSADTLIEYYITAIDSSTNTNEGINNNGGSYYSFTVQDVENPTITSVTHSPVNPNDSDSITISCSVSDNTGILSVTLHYRIDGGSWQTVAMSFVSGSTWEIVIGPFTIGIVIEYYITAIDSSTNANEGINNNSSSYYSFTVQDVGAPSITTVIHDPASPNDSDSVTISCSATDDLGIASVTLHYRIDGGSWQTVAMTFVSGSTWEAVIGPFAVGVVIEYYITAIDTSTNNNEGSNNNGGSYYSFSIQDIVDPTISTIIHNPDPPTDSDSITISCLVSDDLGVATVTLHYRIDGGSWQTVAMAYVSGTTWEAVIGPFSTDVLIEYYITAIDSSANNNEGTNNNGGSYYSFTVQDMEDPTITTVIHSPLSPTDLNTVTISCSISDNTGITSVTLHYRIDDGSWQTVAMTFVSGSTWEANIGPYTVDTVIEYFITAIDSSANANEGTNNNGGSYYSFEIISSDADPPIIDSVSHTPNEPTNIDNVAISCTVTDSSGIASVTLHYRIGGGSWQTVSMDLITGSIYEASIGPFLSGQTISYFITAIDDSTNGNLAENNNMGEYYTFTVQTHMTNIGPLPFVITLFAVIGLVILQKRR